MDESRRPDAVFEAFDRCPTTFFPAYGEECIMDILTCYRDAIQFTHDQTVRYMNKGGY